MVLCLHVSLMDVRNSVNNNKAFDLLTDNEHPEQDTKQK
jgi:hypothetical protein